MSTINITVERITSVEPHNNADKLEIAKLLGTQTIVAKGQYRKGDLVYFFPPDILIPKHVSEKLGVYNYLRSATLNGQKEQCRVAATRLRGIPSYGFVIQCEQPWAVGYDATDLFEGQKYEPVVVSTQGDVSAEPPEFPRYTDIQHYYRNANVIAPGTPVCITEKVHGTNARFGVIRLNGEFEYVAGSHKTVRKAVDSNGRESLYWKPLEEESVLELLANLCNEKNNVVVYAELYGPGVQDMTYGVKAGEVHFRVFDIMINGVYQNWVDVKNWCCLFEVPTVSELYSGPFDPELVEEYTNGPTTSSDGELDCRFKGREGCVIKPLKEAYDHRLGRVIVKSVSADYLGRKGAVENA